MLQDFSILEVKESNEVENGYEVMNKRVVFCKQNSVKKDNKGPADICYIVREQQSKTIFGLKNKKRNKFGSYHYVYGLDTSNVAYISAYISKYGQKASCNETKENVINHQNPNLIHKVTQAIFCVFDIFTEKDLRIGIKFPGGIRKIFYIDDTQAMEANADDLRTVFLSSILRSWCYNTFPTEENTIFLEEINNAKTFEYLGEAINYILSEKIEYKFPNFSIKIEGFLQYFTKYLIATRRFSLIVAYFSKASYADSSLSKYVLQPLKILCCFEDALQFIATLLCSTSSSQGITYEIDGLTTLKKYNDSLELAKFVTSINPEYAEGWLSLANGYLNLKKFDCCLKALNNGYFGKEFSNEEIKAMNASTNIIVGKETAVQGGIRNINSKKNITNRSTNNRLNGKINDMGYCTKTYIDLYYSISQFYLSDNGDIIQDTIHKIIHSPYYSFDVNQRKIYTTLGEIIKEVNFDTFIDLKSQLFCDCKTIKPIDINYNENRNNMNENNQGVINPQEQRRKVGNESQSKISEEGGNRLKIPINPYGDVIINTLIEDGKIFSVVISQDNSYFSSLEGKEDLAIAEVKFCISFGGISERGKYFHTAIKFYNKAIKFCFSQYVYYRLIKGNLKMKYFKTAIIVLGEGLDNYSEEDYKNLNKTPQWIDKVILQVGFEYQASEILLWLGENTKNTANFFKRIINKYKYWIETGHELHGVK